MYEYNIPFIAYFIICIYKFKSYDCSEKLMYQCQMDERFNLTRKELWTLQDDECVDSLVIDTWATQLNFGQRIDKMKRLVLTVGTSVITMFLFMHCYQLIIYYNYCEIITNVLLGNNLLCTYYGINECIGTLLSFTIIMY